MSPETLAATRSRLMALTGLVCLTYALLAIIQNRPDPMWWFIPGAFGILTSIAIWAVFMRADDGAIAAASDELYRSTNHLAQRVTFWVSVAMYPVFALGVIFLDLSWVTVFAAMGTWNAAVYLLLLFFLEWKMS